AGTAKTERLVDFTDGWVNLATSGSGVDTSAGTATVAAHKIAWGSAFEAGQEGIYLERRPEVGDHYQATLVQDGAGDVLGFAGGEILTATQRYSFIVTSNQGQFRVFESATGFTVDIDPLPNGGAYSLAPKAGDTPGACTVGLRLVTPTTVEVYLNGYRVHTQTLDGEVVLFGWTTSWHLSGYLSIENPVLIRGARPQSPRPLKIACVGDSITYGAWASIPYPELLRMMAQNLPGFGRLTMTNLGISGTSSADWASGDQAGQDYSAYDYVLVMLGTNDVQATTPVADYIDNMETITDAIVADGAVPIIGIFPIWSRSDLTGVPGVTASNYAYGTIYRSELRKLARDLAALHLRLPDRPVHLVGDPLEDADENHRPAGRRLQVLEEPDHLAGEQAVGAAGIRFTGALGDRLRPRLRPGHRLPRQIGDAVDEDDPLGIKPLRQIGIETAQMRVVRHREVLVGLRGRVRPAKQAGDVHGIGEAANGKAVAAPVLDRLQPGLEIEADGHL